MDDTIDRSGAAPLYHQIYTALRAEIFDGRYHDSHLPSEQELETRFAVSRITVRRALTELERRGLISRGQGRPTRVATMARRHPAPANLSDDLANLLVMGLETDVTVLDCETIPAPQALATLLGVAAETPILRAERLRRDRGEPVCHITLHLPPWVAPHVSRRALAHRPVLDLLTEAGFVLHHGTQAISALAADQRMAMLLDVAEGAPLLRLERLVRDAEDRVIEHLIITFRADRFTYTMALVATPGRQDGGDLSVSRTARVEA